MQGVAIPLLLGHVPQYKSDVPQYKFRVKALKNILYLSL